MRPLKEIIKFALISDDDIYKTLLPVDPYSYSGNSLMSMVSDNKYDFGLSGSAIKKMAAYTKYKKVRDPSLLFIIYNTAAETFSFYYQGFLIKAMKIPLFFDVADMMYKLFIKRLILIYSAEPGYIEYYTKKLDVNTKSEAIKVVAEINKLMYIKQGE